MNINISPNSTQQEIYKKLEKFFRFSILYPDFPEIPDSIRDDSGKLKDGYSVYKKGQNYFLIDDNKSEYVETLEDISGLKIVFHFTHYELESLHYGEIISMRISESLEESDEILRYNQALERAMSNDDFSGFDTMLAEKLWELYCYSRDTMFGFLEKINLEKVGDYFVVLSTDISFTEEELQIIAKKTS